jgi:hypothetical protein
MSVLLPSSPTQYGTTLTAVLNKQLPNIGFAFEK